MREMGGKVGYREISATINKVGGGGNEPAVKDRQEVKKGEWRKEDG